MGDNVRHISAYAALKNEIARLRDVVSFESIATEKQKEKAMRDLEEIRKMLERRAQRMKR